MLMSDQLLSKYKGLYTKSITHPLTNELCEGTLPDYKLFTYLVQDLKYFTIGINFFARTLSLCDHLPSMLTLGKQIGFIATDENDYFEKSIAMLETLDEVRTKVPSMVGPKAVALPEVKEYLDYLQYLVHDSVSYAELVTALYFMEQVYLGWAEENLNSGKVPKDLAYKYNEWIDLHSGEAFTEWTLFLKSEVDRVGNQNLQDCERAANKVLTLEIKFFDACYNFSQ